MAKTTKVIVCLAVLVLVLGAVIGWLGWRRRPPPEVLNVTVNPAQVPIGETLTVQVRVKLPWGAEIRQSDLKLPDGLDLLKEGRTTESSWRFGSRLQTLSFDLAGYVLGTFDKVTGEIALARTRGGPEKLAITVPELKIEATPDDPGVSAPELAATVTPEEFARARLRRWLPWAAAGAVLLLIVLVLLIWWFARRREEAGAIVRPPWEIAEIQLNDLDQNLPMEPDRFFLSLTSILREYIEATFHVPASTSTTPEFLQRLQQDDTWLDTEQRLTLSEFLTAADIIKFARGEASLDQMRDALKQASRFVVETSDAWRRRQEADSREEPSEVADTSEEQPA